MDLAWMKTTGEALETLGVSLTDGLSKEEVVKRREQHGLNGEETSRN